MSLRRAIEALPDDRESVAAAREVVAFLNERADTPVSTARIARATGIDPVLVAQILAIFADTFVVDFLGDSPEATYQLSPSPVLALEVQRFVRSRVGGEARLQRGTEKFRSRFGTNR